jgi:hypothetical protein
MTIELPVGATAERNARLPAVATMSPSLVFNPEETVAGETVECTAIAATKGKEGGISQCIELNAASLSMFNHERTSRLLRKTEVLSSH